MYSKIKGGYKLPLPRLVYSAQSDIANHEQCHAVEKKVERALKKKLVGPRDKQR